MALQTLQNTFDGGAAGTEITNGNSGGTNGNAFSLSGTGRTYVADPAHGTLAADFTVASGASVFAQWAFTPDAEVVVSMYVKLMAVPGVNSPFFEVRGSGSPAMQLMWTSGGQIRVLSAASGNLHTTSAVTTNTWYRIDVRCRRGTTTSDGQISFAYYLGDGGTPVETGYSSTAVNAGTNAIDALRFGATGGIATARQWRFDSLRAAIDASGLSFYPAFGVNIDPTVTVTPRQKVSAGGTATVTATASDFDGSIVARTWTVTSPNVTAPTITGQGTSEITFPVGATAGAVYDVEIEVEDNAGGTATATTQVTVPKTGTLKLLPGNGTGVGAWTIVGGSANEGAALGDSSDSTRVRSEAVTSTPVTRRWTLEPGSTRATGQLTVRALKSNTGPITVKVRLYEGATMRQEWTLAALTTSAATQTLTFDTGTVAAITDWTNLSVEAVATE